MNLLRLLPLFFKVGLFTVGGGLAAIPLLHELVETQQWMTEEQFLAMIAVSESTPGSIGVNMATFVGVEEFGVLGGIIATIALVLPSLIVITSIARFFPNFSAMPVVKGAFRGIRPAVTGLIGSAAVTLGIHTLFDEQQKVDPVAVFLFLFIIFLHDRYDLSPIFLILIGALAGIFLL